MWLSKVMKEWVRIGNNFVWCILFEIVINNKVLYKKKIWNKLLMDVI